MPHDLMEAWMVFLLVLLTPLVALLLAMVL